MDLVGKGTPDGIIIILIRYRLPCRALQRTDFYGRGANSDARALFFRGLKFTFFLSDQNEPHHHLFEDQSSQPPDHT